MILSVRALEHYRVQAPDGQIGRIDDLYFDDAQWTVRYVVVWTGHWLARQRILLPLPSLAEIDTVRRLLLVRLTKLQVAESPDVHTHEPVSRQHEATLYRYYGFPFYWHGPAVNSAENWEGTGDPGLRSAREVSRYLIREADGWLGRAHDLLLDDDGWTIRYLVVDTQSWWPGKHVLVACSWIRAVRWAGAEIDVDVQRNAVKTAPEYLPARPLTRQDEQRLHAHYGRVSYWDPRPEV